jgi:ketosteroid isomerase-like protein
MTMTLAEYDRIVATVRLYVDGFNEHDAKKFRQAFHPDAQMFYIDEKGILHVHALTDEVFEGWAAEDNGHIQLRIISVAQMGDVASVALSWGHDYLDFHALARADGVWKITNKTASHVSR